MVLARRIGVLVLVSGGLAMSSVYASGASIPCNPKANVTEYAPTSGSPQWADWSNKNPRNGYWLGNGPDRAVGKNKTSTPVCVGSGFPEYYQFVGIGGDSIQKVKINSELIKKALKSNPSLKLSIAFVHKSKTCSAATNCVASGSFSPEYNVQVSTYGYNP